MHNPRAPELGYEVAQTQGFGVHAVSRIYGRASTLLGSSLEEGHCHAGAPAPKHKHLNVHQESHWKARADPARSSKTNSLSCKSFRGKVQK